MDHDVTLTGFNCRLRPVRAEDAAFIVKVRNQPMTKGFIHDTPDSVELQKSWIERYLARAGDYYWVIENVSSGQTIGLIGLYDITESVDEAMPGRWVMYPQTEVNGMAPVFLVYRFAFETLRLKRLVMTVMPENKRVLRFHKLYGAQPISCPERYERQEQESGIHQLWFEITQKIWKQMRSVWEPILKAY